MYNVFNIYAKLQDERYCICSLNVSLKILNARAKAGHIHKWKGTIQIKPILMRLTCRYGVGAVNYCQLSGSAMAGWINPRLVYCVPDFPPFFLP
jgi:hypothetical protein